ncbi:MAG: thermonuclease family protein [Acidimicrobiia bacterium]
MLIAVVLGALAACGPGEQARPLEVPTTSEAGRTTPTLAPGPTTSTTASTSPVSARSTLVDQLVDGNTLMLAGGLSVRLVGVKAPETGAANGEPVECFGPEATRHLASLLPPGSSVRLAYDAVSVDRSGRTVAYVYRLPDNLFVNAALVRDGYARATAASSNQLHGYEFVALQREARRAKRGLWSACAVTTSTSPPVTAAEPTTTTTEPEGTTTSSSTTSSTTSSTSTSTSTSSTTSTTTTTVPPSTTTTSSSTTTTTIPVDPE